LLLLQPRDFFPSGEANFFSRVYLVSAVPFGVALLIGLACALRLAFASLYSLGAGASAAAAQALRDKVISQHTSAFLLLSYCVLPPVALVQVSLF
jgi:hypothetical protein